MTRLGSSQPHRPLDPNACWEVTFLNFSQLKSDRGQHSQFLPTFLSTLCASIKCENLILFSPLSRWIAVGSRSTFGFRKPKLFHQKPPQLHLVLWFSAQKAKRKMYSVIERISPQEISTMQSLNYWTLLGAHSSSISSMPHGHPKLQSKERRKWQKMTKRVQNSGETK